MDNKLAKWTALVFNTLKENPQFLGPTITAINEGIKDRLDIESSLRANAETALSICYDEARSKIPDHQVNLVKSVIKNSGMFKWTEYANNL